MRRVVLALVLALLIPCLAAAQAEPDFSGTWALDAAKSDMGMGRAATAMRTVTLVIRQTKTRVFIERRTGDRPEIAVYNLDGSESVNQLPNGGEVKSTTTWAGATLVTKSVMATGGVTVETSDVRSLSANGKVMTLDGTRHTGRGEVKQKLIYNKQ
jgi:hypothetical protein